jgi:hypothetical protein
LQGDFFGALQGSGIFPKMFWIIFLGSLYFLASIGWFFALKRDREVFMAFTMFALMFAYLIVASGPYVEAKYRLPGMPLIIIAALFGFERLHGIKNALRISGK